MQNLGNSVACQRTLQSFFVIQYGAWYYKLPKNPKTKNRAAVFVKKRLCSGTVSGQWGENRTEVFDLHIYSTKMLLGSL